MSRRTLPLAVLATTVVAAAAAAAAKPKALPRRAPADIATIRKQAAHLPTVAPPYFTVPMHLAAAAADAGASDQGRRVGWAALDVEGARAAEGWIVLADLPPGRHRLRIRDGRSCARGALGAQWVPRGGRKADLREVIATADGTAKEWVTLDFTIRDIAGKLLVVEGDGSGDDLIACGVIPASAGVVPPAKN
jgi:hypothetical protein